jgi:hypothetical protein
MGTTTQTQKQTIDLSQVSSADLEALLLQKKKEERDNKLNRRAAYEGIRADVVLHIEQKVRQVTSDVMGLFAFVSQETEAFRAIMGEYGALRSDNQMSYTLQEENFKIEVKTNKVKKFDERADVAASRLIEFLRAWIANKEKGTEDPMYQLAMTLIERNKYGDLDYKSISKLYDLEESFNSPDYSAIMALFRESHLVESTATNFYFWQKNNLGVWTKLEPSFNRL